MLTPTQLVTLRADIDAGPFAGTPQNSDTDVEIASFYNSAFPTAYFVWKPEVAVAEIMGNGFDWTRVDNLTEGRARIWTYMTALGVINPSQANVRAGIAAAFNQAADANMRLAIFGHCQQQATRGQRLFAVGTGTSTTNAGLGPASTPVYEITPSDVSAARTL